MVFSCFGETAGLLQQQRGGRVWGGALAEVGLPCSIGNLDNSPDPAFFRALYYVASD